MRELRAWAHYVTTFGPVLGWDNAIAKGAVYLYFDRMSTPSDRQHLEDILPARIAGDVRAQLTRTVPRPAVQVHDDAEGRSVRVLDVEVRCPSAGGRELVPDREVAELVLTDATVEGLEKVAQGVVLNEPLLLIGETGVGKTSLIRHLAYLTHNSFQRFNLSGQTEKLHFIGGYCPSERGEFVWQDGVLIEAMRRGQWLVIDEINLAPSQVIERMNSLLDDDGFVVVTEHKGEQYVRQSAYDDKGRAYTEAIMGQRADEDGIESGGHAPKLAGMRRPGEVCVEPDDR